MQRLSVHHTTTYTYKKPVYFEPHRLMLRPRDGHDLRVQSATLKIEPAADVHYIFDVFSNSVAIATFSEPSETLTITSDLVIDRYPMPDIAIDVEPYARNLPFSYPRNELPDLGQTLKCHYSDPGRNLIEWARRWIDNDNSRGGTRAFLETLTLGINKELDYSERPEPGVQSPLETLRIGSGTCRDFAVLMMEAVRSLGLAARFVSGYLHDPSVDEGVQDGSNASPILGAGATHAWVQVYLPGAGWVEFDPTNGIYGGQYLIPVSVAREPDQAIPVSGNYRGAPDDFSAMEVNVMVRTIPNE